MEVIKSELESLIKILESEKEFLIKDDLDNLVKIISLKEEKAKKVLLYLKEDKKENFREDIKKLIFKIEDLQKTNLLLMDQAMSYHANCMDNILKVIQESSKSNTYSENGHYKNKNEANIINRKA